MAKLVAARLQHLTEPNEGIAVRTLRGARRWFESAPAGIAAAGQAVVEYMANSTEANHQALYNRMQAAIRQAELGLRQALRDPHVTIATAADTLLVGRVVGGAERICAWGTTRMAQLRGKIEATRRAGRTLSALEENAQRFAEPAHQLLSPGGPTPPGPRPKGPPPDVGPPPLLQLPERPNTGVPRTCYENQCWPNAQAVDDYWRIGQWIEPTPWGYPLVEELSDLKSPKLRIVSKLQCKHGGANALDPNTGPGGLQFAASGHPVHVPSKEAIEQAIGGRGPGKQRYVFIEWEQVFDAALSRAPRS